MGFRTRWLDGRIYDPAFAGLTCAERRRWLTSMIPIGLRRGEARKRAHHGAASAGDDDQNRRALFIQRICTRRNIIQGAGR
jgi:hypothetical protein